MDKPYLTYTEAGTLLGMSRTSVYELGRHYPDFPVIRVSKQVHVIPRELLDAWCAKHAGDGSWAQKETS
jgi:predicted DNA-binding transcriptional regulator AlpA